MKNFNVAVVPDDFLTRLMLKIETLEELLTAKKQEQMQDKLLTRKEAMEYLRVKDTKFNELRREGFVNPVIIGKLTMYRMKDLIVFCESSMNNQERRVS